VTTNGAVLCVEAIGDPTDPVVLLIMGAGRADWRSPARGCCSSTGSDTSSRDGRGTTCSLRWSP
jgi:hypothetical protein